MRINTAAMLAALVAAGFVAASMADMRPSERSSLRAIKGGTLPADSVAAAEMADADHGDVAWVSGVAKVEAVQADAIVKASLSAVDYGDFTADADGTCTLDADVVAAAEMADADHGDVAWSGGVATVQAAPAAGLTGDVLLSSVTNLLSTGTLATNAVVGAGGETNTVILRTLASGIVLLDSWTVTGP